MGGGQELKNAVSDDEDMTEGAGDGVFDHMDTLDMQQDKLLLQATTTAAAARERKGGGGSGQREVFALSGTDSDSDFDLQPVSRKKEKKKKKKAAEKEEEGSESGLAESDVEDGGVEGGDDVRAWGSKKKHFYGGASGCVHFVGP